MCFKRFHISILKRQTLECRRKYWFVVVFFQVFWQIPTSGCPDGSGYIMVQFIQVGKPICLPFLKHFDESPSWFELLPTQRNKHSNQKTILRNGKKHTVRNQSYTLYISWLFALPEWIKPDNLAISWPAHFVVQKAWRRVQVARAKSGADSADVPNPQAP